MSNFQDRVQTFIGTGVAGASISATSAGGASVTTTTDSLGNFNLNTSAGTYGITITGSGINSYSYNETLPVDSALINNAIYVNGVTYAQTLTGIQTALNAAVAGQAVIVPGPITYSGSGTSLSIPAGVQLIGQGMPTLSFAGLGSTTDCITIAASYPPYRNVLDGFQINCAATGRDAVRVNGGDHGIIRNLYITDAGRDFLNFTSDSSSHWFENWAIEHVRNAYTVGLGSNARDAYHFELPTGLTSVYMNKFVFYGCNVRGYKGNAFHWVVNNSNAGVAFDNWTIIDQETDSVGHASATTNPAFFWDKTSGTSNPFNSFVFIGGSFEDTGLTPTGSIFSASTNSSTLNGLILLGSVNGNFPKFYDSTFFTNVSNIEQFDQNGHIMAEPVQWWKDNSPSQAVSFGNSIPGGALSNDAQIGTFNSGAWQRVMAAKAAGGFDFYNSTGATRVASIDNSGDLQLNGQVQNISGASVMGMTLKKGTGSGNYSTASTSYVDVDATNLAYTVTIPTGWKLSVIASGNIQVATAVVFAGIALFDSSVIVEQNITPPATGQNEPFSLAWVITGDGASHTVKLQFKTSNAADSASIQNSSATLLPTMIFTLMPSN